jgi:hypothetical protein
MKRLLVAIFLLLFAASCAVPLARLNRDRPTVKLFLDVEPAQAHVYLDGIYVGHASSFNEARGGMPVVLGYHVLRFEADGYMPEAVEIIGGETQPTIKVRLLEKPEE